MQNFQPKRASQARTQQQSNGVAQYFLAGLFVVAGYFTLLVWVV